MPATDKRPLRVFLCHAHADRDPVRGLYARLTQDGVDAWLDKEKLLPGQDWELEIRKAVREADVVVVCLSKQFNQAGFRQKEVRLALDTAMEKPEGEIFIIPARLDECDTLESLRKWHWVNLFDDDGYGMLIRALRARANGIGATLQIKKSWLSNIPSPRSIQQSSTTDKPAIPEEKPIPRPEVERSRQKIDIKRLIARTGAAFLGIIAILTVILSLGKLATQQIETTPTLKITSSINTQVVNSPTPVLESSETLSAPLADSLSDKLNQLAFFEFDETNNCKIVLKNSANDILPCPELPRPDIDFVESHWAPDGRYVVIHYKRTLNNENYIYVMSVNPKMTYSVVSDVAAYFDNFFWLVNTGKLFFYNYGGNGVERLSTFDVNTERYTTVLGITSGLHKYSISPNGENIAFESYPGSQHNIYVNDILFGQMISKAADASKVTNFQNGESIKDIDWINNETIFYRMGNDDIYTTLISDYSPRKVGNGILPALSPDRQKLLFYSEGLSIFDLKQNQFLPIPAQNDLNMAYTNATWSIDGKYIALVYENQLVIYSLLENSFIPVKGQFNSPNDIVWSFDNNYITFVAEQDGVSSVFIVRQDGSELVKASGESKALFPVWISQ